MKSGERASQLARTMKTLPSSFFLATVLLAIALSGCASMTSSKEELQNIGENEGVVFGSFVINVEQSEGSESGLGFLKGQKAANATYAVIFAKSGLNPLKKRYLIRAIPEKEAVFIRKLPVGQYQIEKISKEGFTNLELELRDVNFRVMPKQTTYIGKVIMQFPNRIMVGSPVRVNVADAEQEATDSLRGEHEKSLSRVVKELATTR